MLKKIRLILPIFVFVFIPIIISCQTKQSDKKMENENKTLNETNQATRPQYKITVTQKGEVMGEMLIEIYNDVAPKHSHNFDSLVAAKFYDGTAFHRVIPGFMIQGGDPNSKDKPRNMWGYGDPSQTKVPAEFSKLNHNRGIISAARSQDPNSASSQFFICTGSPTQLDGQYSIFGKVINGMDVADKIVNSPRDAKDNPNDKIEMKIEKMK